MTTENAPRSSRLENLRNLDPDARLDLLAQAAGLSDADRATLAAPMNSDSGLTSVKSTALLGLC